MAAPSNGAMSCQSQSHATSSGAKPDELLFKFEYGESYTDQPKTFCRSCLRGHWDAHTLIKTGRGTHASHFSRLPFETQEDIDADPEYIQQARFLTRVTASTLNKPEVDDDEYIFDGSASEATLKSSFKHWSAPILDKDNKRAQG